MSGTGACSLAGSFFKKFVPGLETIYVPDPTWGNHHNVFRQVGLPTTLYKYLNEEATGLDYDGMIASINAAPDGSVFLLHACAHNPTGIDPTLEQWAGISKAMKAKSIVPFMDCAYQGFASGNADTDAAALRLFVEDGHNVMLAQSYAKNFGLYGERIGCLSMVCGTTEEAAQVLSQLKIIIRAAYSNPPIHGAHIVNTILSDPELESQWYAECKGMAERIISMRELLVAKLAENGSSKDWSHITDQIGMFAFSGLTKDQVETLRYEHAIYMTGDGRISMAGVTSANVDYLSKGMVAVTE
jgi:aspartate aminotransferase